MGFLRLLAPVLLVSGCATGVSGPQSAPDGAFVVSVSSHRAVALIDPIDEALAEARFKCWSDRKGLAVLSRQVASGTGALGMGRSATVTFVCNDTPESDRISRR